MMRNRKALLSVAVVALVALAGSGCYALVAGPRASAPPGSAPPGPRVSRPQQLMGLGVSTGFFYTADSQNVNGLSDGVCMNAGISFWLSEIMAARFDVTLANLSDNSSYGGDMTIVPATMSVVFSVPDPYGMSDIFRWRFGVGAGVASLNHTEFEIDSIPVFRMEAGSEWLLQYGGRLFVVADFLMGDQNVEDTTDTWFWDLSVMGSLRFGLEFGF